MILTKLNQHVNEMVTMAGKKFQNLLWSLSVAVTTFEQINGLIKGITTVFPFRKQFLELLRMLCRLCSCCLSPQNVSHFEMH